MENNIQNFYDAYNKLFVPSTSDYLQSYFNCARVYKLYSEITDQIKDDDVHKNMLIIKNNLFMPEEIIDNK